MWKPTAVCIGLALVALTPLAGFAGQSTDDDYRGTPGEHHAVSLGHTFERYARSAESGDAVAQYNVAMMYANGEAVFVDYQQAAYWFGKSAAQGFAPAQYRLGEMFYFARGGLPRNLQRAAALFQAAAEQGDTDAQMNLAMLLGTGEGVPADGLAALRWIEQAIAGGNDRAEPWRRALAASGDGRFSPAQQKAYWDRQRQFWIEEAAEYGVREAQEAVEAMDTAPGVHETAPRGQPVPPDGR